MGIDPHSSYKSDNQKAVYRPMQLFHVAVIALFPKYYYFFGVYMAYITAYSPRTVAKGVGVNPPEKPSQKIPDLHLAVLADFNH